MKKLFYSNITYGCNSNCVFCYSHNTRHAGVSYNEVSVQEYIRYLKDNEICANDRVIVNGGEPLLHSNISDFLYRLSEIGCEVLVYTNGRLLPSLDRTLLTGRFRFVVPIHGDRTIHDTITGVNGRYAQTIEGLRYLTSSDDPCKVDIKIIINNQMIDSEETFERFLRSLDQVPVNHAVHLTKMADTIVSRRNNCRSVDNAAAAFYTEKILDRYIAHLKVKVFDTCIMGLADRLPERFENRCGDFCVLFKDSTKEFPVALAKPHMDCLNSCELKKICPSAVGEYTVLKFQNDTVCFELE